MIGSDVFKFLRSNFYGGDMANMNFWYVVDCARCAPHPTIHSGYGIDPPRHSLFSLTPECVAAALLRPSLGIPGSIQDKLTEWQASELVDQCPRPNTLMPLPHPIGQLVVGGWITSLAMDCRLRITLDCNLAPLWKESRIRPAVGNDEDAAALPGQVSASGEFNSKRNHFCPQMFMSLARDLQLWAPTVVQRGLADAEHIDNYLHWLSECGGQLTMEAFRGHAWEKQSARGGYWHGDFAEHGQFQPLFLTQCVFFSFSTRGASPAGGADPLKTVLMRAVKCLPAAAQGFLDHLLSNARFPSPAALTRFRLYVDVSWMTYMQDVHDKLLDFGNCVFFGASDSSPQGGRNWLMHEYICIPGDKLFEVGEAAFAMQRAAKGSRTDPDLEEMMHGWLRTVRDGIRHHLFPPTGFGVSHKSLAHNLHATFHGMRLENKSWARVQDMCDKYFSHCADRGVESEVAGRRVDLTQNFPYWLGFDISSAGGDELLEDDVLMPPRPLSLERTLDVPGTYHSIDNIQKRTLDTLPRWGEMKSIIEALCQSFHQQYLRDVFVSECLGPFQVTYQGMFQSGPPLFEGGRVWNVLLVICDWFLEREVIIRSRWDLQKMMFRGPGGESRPLSEVGKKLLVCNEGIISYFLWAYLHVLRCFGKFLREIIVWCASCSCHPYDFVQEFNLGADQFECPMRGRRAAEIACGELHELVETRLQLRFTRLLHALRGLTTQQRRVILDVFETGKANILDEFAIRFSCYKHLPLKLLCIGHYDVRKAREHLVHCLCLYQLLENRGSFFTESLLNPLHKRAQVLAVVQGFNAFEEFPDLHSVRVSARMTSTMEVSVERIHKDLHQNIKLAPNHSTAYASLSLRKREILSAMEADPNVAFALAGIVGSTRSAAEIISTLGLKAHPCFAAYFDESGNLSSQIPHWLLLRVIYRCDTYTQFAELPDPERAH
jgi:hypothetical protein